MTMVKTCDEGNFIHMEQALSAGGQTITAAVYTAEWMDDLKKYSTKMSAPAYGNSSTIGANVPEEAVEHSPRREYGQLYQ